MISGNDINSSGIWLILSVFRETWAQGYSCLEIPYLLASMTTQVRKRQELYSYNQINPICPTPTHRGHGCVPFHSM